MTVTATRGALRVTGGFLSRREELFDFYVDSAAGVDSNPGTRALPWKTIAKVNGSTFTAGQRIGLKRGAVWTEELVLPSGGATGNPIIVGAYGTGPAPLISGAAVLSGWTAYIPPTTPQELLTNGTFEDWPSDISPPSNWTRFQPGGSTTSRVPSITGSGLYSLRLTSDAEGTNVSISQNVGLVAGTQYTLSFVGRLSALGRRAGVTITIPSGTYAGYSLQPDGTWSTAAGSIELTSTAVHTITLPFTMLPETATVSLSVKRIVLTNGWAEFDNVSVLSAGAPPVPPPNTFQVSAPNRVWTLSRDDVAVVEGSSRDTLADRQFKWSGGFLYVRDDSGNPGGHLYEAGATRAHAVTALGKAHVRVRDLAARHITGRAFRADEGAHDTIFQRIHVRHAGRSDQTGSFAGVLAVRNSDDCMVLDCTVYGADNDGIHGWNATRMKVLRNRLGVCNGPSSDNIQIDAFYYYDTALPRFDLDTEVAHNYCDQRGTNSPKGNIILIHDGSRAHHNTCYGGNFQVASMGSRVRVDHNILIDNALGEAWGGAVRMTDAFDYDDIEFDHNLIINPEVGIRIGDDGVAGVARTNVREHHNTIVLTADSLGGIWHELSSLGGETADNIVYGASSGPVLRGVAGSWASDRNVLGPERSGFLELSGVGHAALAAWRTATGQEAASVSVDPALDGGYAPTAGLLSAGHLGDGA